jgi:6-pyruvoyltetrahydropterin/6-carboxytetrahydropterin synthase
VGVVPNEARRCLLNRSTPYPSPQGEGESQTDQTMKITQAFTFEAAHRLPNVPTTHRCHRMHGHSYRVELTVAGPVDPKTGWVIDFYDIEAIFGPLLARLDHHCLNEIEGLENPTAENIAAWIWHRLRPDLPGLALVRVAETPMSWAEYDGD